MKDFTLKDYLIYDTAGKPIGVKPLPEGWTNRASIELAIVREWGVFSAPINEDDFPELIGIQNTAPAAVKAMYKRYLKRHNNTTLISPEEEAESPWSRWNTPPGVIKTISKPTPEQIQLAREINAQRVAAKKAAMEGQLHN